MSLSIDTNHVIAVLLADGWHKVLKETFDVDAYEFVEGDRLLVGGGSVPGVPSTGAMWVEAGGKKFCAPLTAIMAVRTA